MHTFVSVPSLDINIFLPINSWLCNIRAKQTVLESEGHAAKAKHLQVIPPSISTYNYALLCTLVFILILGVAAGMS